ncbi:unnamed protein product [Rotaria socialis]
MFSCFFRGAAGNNQITNVSVLIFNNPSKGCKMCVHIDEQQLYIILLFLFGLCYGKLKDNYPFYKYFLLFFVF